MILFKKQEFAKEKTKYWGLLTLNNPKALNALTHPMVREIKKVLAACKADPDCLGLFIDGSGDRAFCAGGDVRSLAQNIEIDPLGAAEFFKDEYEMDYAFHLFPKPLVAWGSGIVMGGGLGIFQGASFRIHTPDSVLAMPELAIGLFPDVGATFFLGKLPQKIGLFLGLTGARLTPRDSLRLGLCDAVINANNKREFCDQLWLCESFKDVYKTINIFCLSEDQLQKLPTNSEIFDWIPRFMSDVFSIEDFYSKALAQPDTISPWLKTCFDNFFKGCPFSAAVTFRQLAFEAPTLSLKECFELEGRLMPSLAMRPDFREGVRSRLIDKDNLPNWSPKNASDLKSTDIQKVFDAQNPKNLGLKWALELPPETHEPRFPRGWKKISPQKMGAHFVYKNHSEAFEKMTQISKIADTMGHHPEWSNVYNRLTIELTTHDAAPEVGGRITELDQILAKAIGPAPT